MAFTTYAELKTEIIDFSHRGDLQTKLDSFIDLAESEMFANDIAPLKFRQEETRATATLSTSSRYLALPTGFKQMRRLRIELNSNDSNDIRYKSPEQLPIKGASGLPEFFTVTSQIEFDITPDSAYTVEMQYFKDFTALSSSNTSNAILTNHPTVYLWGSLWALYNYTLETQLANQMYGNFITALKGANKKYKKGRFGAAPVMRIEGCTP
jgi:hypothetical protein